MKCDHEESSVLETRVREDCFRYRRRDCNHCHALFSTVEVPIEQLAKLQAEATQLGLLRTVLRDLVR